MIRRFLLRVPVLGPYVERRWMPDPVERDAHREVVRARLEPQAKPDPPSAAPDAPQLTGGAPED
jgi:hypothetical protein